MQLRIRRLASGIRGLTVSRAYRSHGSMIHFHFGPLQEWYRRDGEARYHGAYGLMVEIAVWTIARHAATLATDASSDQRIDRVLAGFLGRRVVCARFGRRCTELGFENGLRLSLSPRGPEWGPWHRLQNWTVFRGESAALELTNKARLELCS